MEIKTIKDIEFFLKGKKFTGQRQKSRNVYFKENGKKKSKQEYYFEETKIENKIVEVRQFNKYIEIILLNGVKIRLKNSY